MLALGCSLQENEMLCEPIMGCSPACISQYAQSCCIECDQADIMLLSLLCLLQALLYNQPVISEQDDGSVVVLVHALVAPLNVLRPATEGALLTSRAASPEYWLKLKRPQAIAEVCCVLNVVCNSCLGGCMVG
jgi:hypothetical protein